MPSPSENILAPDIGKSAVQDSHIASVSVGKLLAGSIGVSQYIGSPDFVTRVSGWRINGDGSAEFNDVVVRGDIVSGNWDGGFPTDLSSVDDAATAGFYLDSSTGSAQFEGDVYVGGTLGLKTGGLLQTADVAPRWIIDIDNYGAQDFVYESGLPNEYAVGGINVINIDTGGTEWGGVVVAAPQIGDGTNRGQAALQVSSVETATDNYGYVDLQATGWGSHDAIANLTTLADSGDATVTIQASSSTGSELIDLYSDVVRINGNSIITWSAWSPTLTNIAIGTGGNAGTTARYIQIGDTVHCTVAIVLGTSGASVSGIPTISLPVTAAALPTGVTRLPRGTCILGDAGTAAYAGMVESTSTTNARFMYHSAFGASSAAINASTSSTVPFTWTAGDWITAEFTYEAA